ncbi:PHP domain-containing protein [bacterium]|nr:PHP domain-containing protein [candidate division CSSED10-310 bacterium]
MTLRQYRADLHIHTCLSPCGDLEMSPKHIVQKAIAEELSIIAITDHNAAMNVNPVQKAAEGKNIMVIPGLEITSQEEVHILALFENCSQAEMVQAILFESMDLTDNETYIQDQVIANEFDEVEGFCRQLLMGATKIQLKKIVELIHSQRGLAIAAHIDRQAFGIIGQLGFLPPDIHFDGLEVSPNTTLKDVQKTYAEYTGFTFITSSDAHYLKDIGSVSTTFLLQDLSFVEITKAFKKQDGRGVVV